MTVTIVPPKTVSLAIFTCDRDGCGRTIEVEYESDQEVPSEPELPAGWRPAGHPDVGDETVLTFHSQSCMSVWFATYVRVLYGGPEELPKRRSRKVEVSTLPEDTTVSGSDSKELGLLT